MDVAKHQSTQLYSIHETIVFHPSFMLSYTCYPLALFSHAFTQGSQYRIVPVFRPGLGTGTVYRAVHPGVPSTVALLQCTRTGNRRSAYQQPVGPVRTAHTERYGSVQ